MLLEAEAQGCKFGSLHRCDQRSRLKKHMAYLAWESICQMYQNAKSGVLQQLEYIRKHDAIMASVLPQEAYEVGKAGDRWCNW